MSKFKLLLLCLLSQVFLIGQSATKEVKKELGFTAPDSNNLLIISNIEGDIIVKQHDEPTIFVQVNITIDADSEEYVKLGMEEIDLGIAQKSKTIYLYMDNPCADESLAGLSEEGIRENRFRVWKNNCDWQAKYEFRLDYYLQVPKTINLDVSTINNGVIEIKDIEGKLTVNNLNGDVRIENIVNELKVSGLNGNIDLFYAKNPNHNSKYYTLNGNINAWFLPGLSANLYFKTFSGDFYTNFEASKMLTDEVEEEKFRKWHKI